MLSGALADKLKSCLKSGGPMKLTEVAEAYLQWLKGQRLLRSAEQLA